MASASSSSTSELRKTIQHTITDYLSSYADAVASKDSSLLSRALAPSCRRFTRPAAFVAAFGLDPDAGEDTATYSARMAGELVLMTSARVEEAEGGAATVIDAEARRAAFRSVHWLALVAGPAPAPGAAEWVLEFDWFVHLSDDGTRITRIVQMIDTAEGTRFVQAMQAAAQEMQKQ